MKVDLNVYYMLKIANNESQMFRKFLLIAGLVMDLSRLFTILFALTD